MATDPTLYGFLRVRRHARTLATRRPPPPPIEVIVHAPVLSGHYVAQDATTALTETDSHPVSAGKSGDPEPDISCLTQIYPTPRYVLALPSASCILYSTFGILSPC